MEHGRLSRRGLCRYQRIKIMNEQRHGWLVMKYQFSSAAEYRIPIYRIRRERTYRKYFRMKLAGRATERVFQFHRPFRGKAAFRMSAFRPRYGLMKTNGDNIDSLEQCPKESALLSQPALAEDWESPEEGEAWKHL